MSDVIEFHPKERPVCSKCQSPEFPGPILLVKIEGTYHGIHLCGECASDHVKAVFEAYEDAHRKLVIHITRDEP